MHSLVHSRRAQRARASGGFAASTLAGGSAGGFRRPIGAALPSARPGLFGAVAAALMLCGVAAAQTASLPPVVVTAAQVEQALPDALPSARVITRREIEQTQPADLPALLRMLTSVDVAQSGPLGAQTSVFLRGADSRQTLVLVDGVPINRADFGIASLQHLPVDQIERIEIVRGNVSSLYGAQAVGGVIQVFTRRARAPELSVGFGSRGTRRGSAAYGTRFGDELTPTDVSVGVTAQHTDGYSAKDPAVSLGANPDRDAASQRGGSARVAQTWARGQVTTLNLLAGRTRSEYDGFDSAAPDVLTTRLGSVALHSQHSLGDAFELGVDLGRSSERFDDPTGFAVDGRNRVQRGALQLQWQPSAGQTLQIAAERASERFADSATPERRRRNDALRLGWVATPPGGAFETQVALRHDDNETYGNATTGLVALGWRFAPQWKLSVQGGTAFSAPSFVDEQFANPAVGLKAERSRNAELALQWHEGETLLRAAWFVQRQRDRIAFDPVSFETGNIARAENRGLELLATLALGAGRLGAEATFQDPRNSDTDQPLKRRARRSAALSYGLDSGPWSFSSALRYTGKRLDTDPVTFGDAWVRARTTLDVGVQRVIAAGWRALLKIENLGDEDRPEVLGYTAAPRSLFVGLRWSGMP